MLCTRSTIAFPSSHIANRFLFVFSMDYKALFEATVFWRFASRRRVSRTGNAHSVRMADEYSGSGTARQQAAQRRCPQSRCCGGRIELPGGIGLRRRALLPGRRRRRGNILHG